MDAAHRLNDLPAVDRAAGRRRTPVRILATVGRVTNNDITGYRRSLAMSPSLTRGETERLIDDLEALIRERDRALGALGALERLAPAFAEVRNALNELHRNIKP